MPLKDVRDSRDAPPRTCERAPPATEVAKPFEYWGDFGAGEGARTLDPDLGKVVLYH